MVMVNLQFSDHLDTRSANENAGDLFQKFVHELLLYEHPNLHFFPGGGKDGGIDLIQDADESRLIVECKYISKGGLIEARKRWKEVADNLQTHLVDPEGPTKSQSQYKPWYRTNPSINEYLFCISSVLANSNQVDELKEEITQLFTEMSVKYNHLSHLAHIKVRVLDWNDFSDRLRQRPHMLFRWFPTTRPQGLVPLDEIPNRGTFRSYLSSDKLPYYSRQQFLESMWAPQVDNIPNEEEILNQIDDENITGLVVTGSGGVGKTRFTLEIGRLAKQKGWLVMRVLNRLHADALEQLVEMITPGTRVLFLFDYIETQRNFVEIVQTIGDLNDTYSLHLRYVANCRTTYYTAIAAASIHKRIDLSPITQQLSQREWAEAYQKQTVSHILKHSEGLEITESHLKICRNIPVFAVFISYLHSTGRHPELQQLVDEENFSSWVLRRVQLTFGSSVIPRHLAIIAALFPMPVSVVPILGQEMYSELLDKLATDGWVEKLLPDVLNPLERWEAAQDVFADQIFISYLKSIPYTVESFISELLSLAAKVGCLRSALLSLERVKDHLLVESLSWPRILKTKMSEDPTAWHGVRDLLIRITLLNNQQIIDLLGENVEVWSGIEEDVSFQYSLGYLARWAKDQPENVLTPAARAVFSSWIKKSANHATLFNYVITSGLLLSPDIVRDSALNWIVTRPTEFQTHYLLRAWMVKKLPLEEITISVKQWLKKFPHIFHHHFIVKAWLDAGGDKDLVRDTFAEWLTIFKANVDAEFVYKSWLDADGDKELVQSAIKEWLVEHKTEPQAQFVYQSWLDAGGDKEFVREAIAEWLTVHKTRHDAEYVYQAWLEAGGDKEFVRDAIAEWLAVFKTDIRAEFVYQSWLRATGDREFVREAIAEWLTLFGTSIEAGFVYKAWLDAGGGIGFIQDSISQWLVQHKASVGAGLIYEALLDAGVNRNLVQPFLLDWLREHETEEKADFVYRAWNKAGGEFSVIAAHAFRWLNKNSENAEAVFLLKDISTLESIPPETIRDILKWCRKFPAHEDVLWRLTRLRTHLFNVDLAEDVCLTSEVVFEYIINNHERLSTEQNGQITTLFSYLIAAPNLREGPLRERVDSLLLRWINNPDSYGDEPKPHGNIQRLIYVQRVVDLISGGDLNVEQNQEAIKRFLIWVNNWELRWKSRLRRTFDFLKHNYPSVELWDIVSTSASYNSQLRPPGNSISE